VLDDFQIYVMQILTCCARCKNGFCSFQCRKQSNQHLILLPC